MLNAQFSSVFLGFVLSAAAGHFLDGAVGRWELLFFSYFLLRFVYYYSHDLRIVGALELQEDAYPRSYQRELPTLVCVTLSAIAASVAGRTLDRPTTFLLALACSSLFALSAVALLHSAYHELEIDGVRFEDLRNIWIAVGSVEVVLAASAFVLVEVVPQELKRELIESNWLRDGRGIEWVSVKEFDESTSRGTLAVLLVILSLDMFLSVQQEKKNEQRAGARNEPRA